MYLFVFLGHVFVGILSLLYEADSKKEKHVVKNISSLWIPGTQKISVAKKYLALQNDKKD